MGDRVRARNMRPGMVIHSFGRWIKIRTIEAVDDGLKLRDGRPWSYEGDGVNEIGQRVAVEVYDDFYGYPLREDTQP